MTHNESDWSHVENIDYRAPVDEFDVAFEKLREATEVLADHKRGKDYEHKAEQYIRAAFPVALLIRTNPAHCERFGKMVEANKIKVRAHAKNREIVRLFMLAQKRLGSATSSTERNKWASIIAYALRLGMTVDEVMVKVKALNGITPAATAFRLANEAAERDARGEDANEADVEPTVQVKLCVVGVGDDIEIAGIIPALLAEKLAKNLRSALAAGGAQ